MENELGIFSAAIDTLKTIADAINGVVTVRAIVNSHEESAHDNPAVQIEEIKKLIAYGDMRIRSPTG